MWMCVMYCGKLCFIPACAIPQRRTHETQNEKTQNARNAERNTRNQQRATATIVVCLFFSSALNKPQDGEEVRVGEVDVQGIYFPFLIPFP